MAIAHDPAVLILDEPSSGIAQRETEALGPLLKRIQAEAGCAMLIIEHDMPLITSVSDEIIALELGRVVCQGTPDEVMRDPQVIASYLGGDIATIQRSGAAHEGKGAGTSLPDTDTESETEAASTFASPAKTATAKAPAKAATAKKTRRPPLKASGHGTNGSSAKRTAGTGTRKARS